MHEERMGFLFLMNRALRMFLMLCLLCVAEADVSIGMASPSPEEEAPGGTGGDGRVGGSQGVGSEPAKRNSLISQPGILAGRTD